MGIMPHTDIEAALDLSLSLDIPFWPQLPKINFYQDMYAQASQNFPGIRVDYKRRKLTFNTNHFQHELWDYTHKMTQTETFALTGTHSTVYNNFIQKDLRQFAAIKGQILGPISLGYYILDEERKPIIYNNEVRILLNDFIQKKINYQYRQLVKKNSNAFIWIDEPGLNYVFNGLFAYNDQHAKQDYLHLLAGLEGPKAIHLCININLPYLLQLGIEVLSFDAYHIELIPQEYAKGIAEYIHQGGIISWGIVPTEITELTHETPSTLLQQILNYWQLVSSYSGISQLKIAENSLIAPARCCVKNLATSITRNLKINNQKPTGNEETTVHQAFNYLKEISVLLKDRFGFQ